MAVYGYRILYLFCFLYAVNCNYPPIGDEIQPGSVLLPATRRGRYLANIIRRQGVDGTGIQFNKDADRMNAESKKKVDVLSDELLPYIIAEQDRRTTLYKRVMAAIQSGEKGITIAEIRNKPPLLIRKGLFYRCPSNRVPKEPDGSGALMCENDLEPTQVMYDSCLSAEDRDLYVADNKYFFCNRHRVEGPDLPRNGSVVTACAPAERTSLNYTANRCALEDTDDVVVHYRYYPDRTYKSASDLDPDREVCEHWNPCQIGYIFSLPSSDQSLLANELWRNYAERISDYERDELVPPIPEDSITEYVHPSVENYTISRRKLETPKGYKLSKLIAKRPIDGYIWDLNYNPFDVVPVVKNYTKFFTIDMMFPGTFSAFYYADYYAVFKKEDKSKPGPKTKTVQFLSILQAETKVQPLILPVYYGENIESPLIPFSCKCKIQNVVLRPPFGPVMNVEKDNYAMLKKNELDEKGKRKQYIQMNITKAGPHDIGDYFAFVTNNDGREEQVKFLTLEGPDTDEDNDIKVNFEIKSVNLEDHYNQDITYTCDSCKIKDVLCGGVSVIGRDARVSLPGTTKAARFEFIVTSDDMACVYMGVFEDVKKNKSNIAKRLLVLDNKSPDVEASPVSEHSVKAPEIGEKFEHSIPFKCATPCTVEMVTVDGMQLQENDTSSAHFILDQQKSEIKIVFPFMVPSYVGFYQAVFSLGQNVTKTIMEIIPHSGESDSTKKAEERPDEKSDVKPDEKTDTKPDEKLEGKSNNETDGNGKSNNETDSGRMSNNETDGNGKSNNETDSGGKSNNETDSGGKSKNETDSGRRLNN